MNKTKSGKKCLDWPKDYKRDFPNRGLEKNYCRNPVTEDHEAYKTSKVGSVTRMNQIWCITDMDNGKYEECVAEIKT